jgi:hypothetical protein
MRWQIFVVALLLCACAKTPEPSVTKSDAGKVDAGFYAPRLPHALLPLGKTASVTPLSPPHKFGASLPFAYPIASGVDVTCTSTTPGSCVVGAISGSTPVVVTPNELKWASTATPLIDQASTSGATGATATWKSQASTNGNGTPGNLVAEIPSPTGSGSYGQFQVNDAGNVTFYADNQGVLLGRSSSSQQAMRIAPLIGQETTFAGVWLGSAALAPTGSNYHWALAASVDFFGAVTQELAAGEVTLNNTSYSMFAPSAGANYTFQGETPASDVAPGSVVLAGAAAYASAVTNVTGGNIVLQPGAGASSNGIGGSAIVNLSASSGSNAPSTFQVQQTTTPVWTLSTYPNIPSFSMFYAGANSGADYTMLVETGNANTTITNTNGGPWYTEISGALIHQIYGAGVALYDTSPPSPVAGAVGISADAIYGLLGTSSNGETESMTRLGSGTINSQLARWFKCTQEGRTTSSGTVVLTCPIPSGHQAQGWVSISGRVAIAGGTANVGDVNMAATYYYMRNVGGTVSSGADATLTSNGNTSTSQIANTVTFGTSGAAITITATQLGASNTGTDDWILTYDGFYN